MSREDASGRGGDPLDPRLQGRLFRAFAIVTAVFVLLVAVLLPYRLYERDLRESRNEAREASELIRTGLLSTMITSGDSEQVRALISTYRDELDFQFRMVRSRHVESQHGVREDEQATDDLVRQVLETGRSREDWIDRTTFRYVAPFIADERCQECHESAGGDEIAVGEVLGASELVFDLSRKERESVRLIVDVVLVMVAALVTMGLIFYLIVKKGLLESEAWGKRRDA